MNDKVCSINFDEKDLRAKEFLVIKDMIYNYSTLVVKSTSVNYSNIAKNSEKSHETTV